VRPGQRIGDGRYEFIEPIGSGGFGRVWKARDHRLQADVAVKGLWLPPSASPTEQEERLARSEREVLNAARLRDHPNIVSVHDVVVEDDVPWIVMQLVVGRALNARLRESGPLSVSEATDVARAMLKALDAAHGAGIVHRDIKPANVILADNGEILLTDFGIATHESDTSLTMTGSVIGSVPYMAPERVHGEKGQAPSDLFSLGVTLHEILEGASPFDRDSTPASLHAVAYEEPPQPQRAGTLTPLITRLLAKAPEDRPTVTEALALIDSPPSEATPRQDTGKPTASTPTAPTPTAIVTQMSVTPQPQQQAPTPPEAMPTATAPALSPMSATPAGPPVAAQWTAMPVPPSAWTGPSGGSGVKWVGWVVALAVGVVAVVLFAISKGDDTETAGTTGTSLGGGAFENSSDVFIEDESTVESRIVVEGVSGNAPASLGVAVDVTHEYISDLEIELIAPDGTSFELEAYDEPHNYTVDASAVSAGGTWTLRIEDTAGADVGTLNSWRLEFGSPGGTALGGGAFENSADVFIEDESTVESTIEVGGVGGNAPGSLGVAVDITHELISDLEIELIAPDGTSFALEEYDEPHEYTVDASAAVADGTWTLRIEDTAGADVGTLNSWGLEFEPSETSVGAGSFENTSPVSIADEATVESTIEVTGVAGNAHESLGVAVNFSHEYIGDLELELTSPNGVSFDLGEPVDEQGQFTIDASGAVASGTWTLRIEDTMWADEGTLNSWALHF
jgi:serine/threonine protein kinase/subtilisin-like proprotein convertase family protein